MQVEFKRFVYLLFIAAIGALLVIYNFKISTQYQERRLFNVNSDKNADIMDFEGFDNLNGTDSQITPNIVHLIYLQETNITFYQMVNIFSILLNHKPSTIMIHCDNCSFYGKYWHILKNTKEFMGIVKINKIPFRKTIFGVEYGWINHHRSDVWRLLVLMNYGGIYLDNDVYVVNSLDKYRKYEMVVSYENDKKVSSLGTQVLIAHRNARLLKSHFDAYRYNYTRNEWYWNAGYVPAKILRGNPELAHIVPKKLGTHFLTDNLFHSVWNNWKDYDTIHLLINHRYYLDSNSPIKEFDEFNIKNYKYTYGSMVRDILHRQGLFNM